MVVSSCVGESSKYFTSIPNVDWLCSEDSNKFHFQIHTSVLSPFSFFFHSDLLIKIKQASLKYQERSEEEIPACSFVSQKQELLHK